MKKHTSADVRTEPEFAFLTCREVSVLRRISHRCGRRVQEAEPEPGQDRRTALG